MNCLIVDDNKVASTALRNMIAQIEFLTLKEECNKALNAFNYLSKEPIDLVFLNVDMAGKEGIEIIQNLQKRPIIILISAKKDYKMETVELNVADCITKPFTLPRFMLAVSKAKKLFENNIQKVEISENEKNYIFVRSNSAFTKIKVNEIIYAQALGDYVSICTKDKDYTVHITLKGLQGKLFSNRFYRLHRSYLVSLDHVDGVEKNTAFVGKNPLPIGEQFKKDLLKKLNLI